MNPMSTFIPDVACRVHDQLNDRVLDWRPEWAEHYRQYASEHDTGVIGWTGYSWTAGWVPDATQVIDRPPAAVGLSLTTERGLRRTLSQGMVFWLTRMRALAPG